MHQYFPWAQLKFLKDKLEENFGFQHLILTERSLWGYTLPVRRPDILTVKKGNFVPSTVKRAVYYQPSKRFKGLSNLMISAVHPDFTHNSAHEYTQFMISISNYSYFLWQNTYMFFAGWEVRIVKNCEGSIFKTEVTVFHDTDRPKAGK